jgi:phosphoglycerate dehydrogenase-like enzyme
MKIVLYDQFAWPPELVAQIRQAAPQANVVAASQEDLADQLGDAEIFFGYHTPEVFAHAPRLRWIQASAAGLDRLLTRELRQKGVIITNASGVHAPAVAETAWALTLAIARGLPIFFGQQRAHVWKWAPLLDLDGATAGVVGLGGIGRRYARIAAALDMRVLAVDKHVTSKPAEVSQLWPTRHLPELLRQSDVVLLSCPYTPETYHLLNAERLALMKPGAILVNIARGGLIDETALADALRAGKLAGAGLDVCETEPLGPESPLWDVPNLVLTPHCAGLSRHRMRRLTEFFVENLRRYQAGQPLLNQVDQEKGYPVPGASSSG